MLAGKISRGQGRDRTGDPPLFRRLLVPTELPGLTKTSLIQATQTGLEPATSAVTGRRANQLRYWAKARTLSIPKAYPRRDSNPRLRRERAMSLATGRQGQFYPTSFHPHTLTEKLFLDTTKHAA